MTSDDDIWWHLTQSCKKVENVCKRYFDDKKCPKNSVNPDDNILRQKCEKYPNYCFICKKNVQKVQKISRLLWYLYKIVLKVQKYPDYCDIFPKVSKKSKKYPNYCDMCPKMFKIAYNLLKNVLTGQKKSWP